MKGLLSSLAFSLLATSALSAPPPIPPPSSSIVPKGSTSAAALTTLTSPTNFDVPRTHIHGFKPWSEGQVIDNGSNFASKTAVVTVEIPDDATMVQLVLANQGTNAYTLSVASVWGSSQLFAPGYTGGSYGVTPYDATGTAITYMQPFSFGNGGADIFPTLGSNTAAPAAAATQTTTATTSTASTTLTLGNTITCPPDGSTVVAVANSSTGNPLFFGGTTTTVGGCTSASPSTIVISNVPRVTVPSGATIYFLPPNITVAASNQVPLQNGLIYSDWVPITTYTRLDGPIAAGMTILRGGTPLSGTVSSITATTAVMGTALASDVPPGTALQACLTGTTSGSLAPNYTLQFAANAAIQAGQLVSPSTSQSTLYYWPTNSVASVATATNTTVTLTAPLPQLNGSSNWPSATTIAFITNVTVTAPASAGQAIFFISPADAAKLQTGWSPLQGGNSGAFYGTTISAINTGTGQITMSGNISAALTTGEVTGFYFTAPTNASSTAAVQMSFSPSVANMVAGMTAVNASLPANDYIFRPSGSSAFLLYAPTATINSGSTIYLCNTVTTSADSPAGQSNLNFTQTNWPNRLVTLRLNYSGSPTNAGYWFSNTDTEARQANLPGNPARWFGSNCSTTTGVLTPANISNTGGGCGYSAYIPLFALKFYSARRGIDIAVVGDSHFAGDTTFANYGSYTNRAAALISNPNTLPVWPVNLAWGGKPSMLYGPAAWQFISDLKPSVVAIQWTTSNDTSTLAGVANMSATANAIASGVQAYGGLPVLTPDYQRQMYGVTVQAAVNDAGRLTGEALLLSAATAGAAVFDPNPILADPVNGATWLNPAYSFDGVHANDAGHAALAAPFKTLLCGYLRC